MTQKNDIRKRYYEQGKNISEISRETGYDRKTIRRYVEQTDWNIEPATEKKLGRPTKLTPYKEQIDLWLERKIKNLDASSDISIFGGSVRRLRA